MTYCLTPLFSSLKKNLPQRAQSPQRVGNDYFFYLSLLSLVIFFFSIRAACSIESFRGSPLKSTLVCYTVVSLCCSTLAGEVCLRKLTLSQAEELACEYNKDFLISQEGTVEAKERKLQSISKWLPSIHFDALYRIQERREFFFDVFSPVLRQSKYGYHSQLQWDQPIFSTKLWYGLFAKQLEEQSASFNQAATLNELYLSVRENYYAVSLFELALGIQRENIDYLSEALLQEHQKLEAGNSTPFEVNQSKVSVANAISEYYQTLQQLKEARNALILTLGVSPMLEPELSLERAEIPLSSIPLIALKVQEVEKKYRYKATDFPTTMDFLLHIDRIEDARKLTLFSDQEVLEYIELAIDARPDLQKSRLLVDIANQELKQKEGKYFPEMSGFVRYGYNEDYIGTKRFSQEKYYFSGGLALTWNLFDSLLREHEIKEASSHRRSARISLSKELDAIEVQIRNGLYRFEEALLSYLSSDQAVLLAEQARLQAQEKLACGRISPLEYRDSVNQLAKARNLRNRASYQLIEAHYQLRYATGQDVVCPSLQTRKIKYKM